MQVADVSVMFEVTYQTDLFLEKNKDLVVPEHQALLAASKCSFLSSLFPPAPQESSAKSSKLSSIASGFKLQLQTLLDTLSATEPHYVRCVKPNNALKPGIFEKINVLQQLRCGGVLEAIRISCAGFPSRKPFRDFIDRFSILAPEVLSGSYNEVAACKKILEKSNLTGCQVGKTQVFLRAGQMAELDARRSEILGVSAIVIQRKVRAYLKYKNFKLLRISSIKIQAFSRGQVARYEYQRVRRGAACLNIQKHSRRFLARKAYKNLYFSSVSIQAVIHGMTARKQLLSRKQMKAAIVIQAAKATDALLETNNKLEKQVEELTWELQKLQRELDKERSGSNNTAGQVPVIQGVPVVDNESMNKLASENEQLKAQVATLEQKVDVTEKKYEETNKLSEQCLKQAVEAEKKIIELKTAMQRLEEKISDMETEDKVLRQQALLSAPSRKISSQSSFTTPTPMQNGQQAQLNSGPSLRFGREDSKMWMSKIESMPKADAVDSLIKCTEQNLGFSQEKPVAAFTIYKCLVYWRSLEVEKTSVFDNLIQMIGSALEIVQTTFGNCPMVIAQTDNKYLTVYCFI
ncbi:hypothetical protein V6N11_018674 [Hibiscus sabdariffa]|uniref:Myosin motor domain-containing protein n=2 Tax=Hibiscus sabdariffa TaxID=183260 RepID=A0ABR2QSY7_9ROSI